MAEALLFAAEEPLDEASIAARLPDEADVPALLAQLTEDYSARGVNLVTVGGRWQFRTAEDLRYLLQEERQEVRKLSKAALETLAIIAYHQPVTRAEVEELRGVSLSKGTLDILMEIGWVKLRGRRRSPGRPVTYGTSDDFVSHFGLESLGDLPGIDELKAAGLLNRAAPADWGKRFANAEEDPLEDDDEANRLPGLSLAPEVPADA
ncbi:MAG: SMC-Scp complex subunit ScpB [Alphaproteobacteria bacterium]